MPQSIALRTVAYLLLVLLLPAVGVSETMRYITDDFVLPLRKGSDATFRILKMLRTGTPVAVLEKGTNGWTRVRTQDGVEGWIENQYLLDAPPARSVAGQYQEERARLLQEVTQLKSHLTSQEALQTELNRIKATSANALNLERENQELKSSQARMTKELEELTREKLVLEKESSTQYFLAGAGVLALGLIGGGFLFRRRRRSGDMLD